MSVVTMKQLLESGVHFGHQTHKWNPKMDRYIFIKRNGIHILDLKQTLDAVNEAYMFIKDVVSQGGSILFVGTKKQAKEAIEQAAKKCSSYYVNNRWYGGMLTNMRTIRRSIEKLDYFEQISEDGTINSFTKLEATRMRRSYEKIKDALEGIREMERMPAAIFIVDIIKESIALSEARKLNIPIVAMVDTNADPDLVDYVIPANDDAIRAIQLVSDIMANAVIEGRQIMTEGSDSINQAVVEEVQPENLPEESDKDQAEAVEAPVKKTRTKTSTTRNTESSEGDKAKTILKKKQEVKPEGDAE
ncbi:MAG: 30S ribosomal protein S2 [Candidatus Cloacimonetes bacterium]|nr:30S ribosomal protein S2 [Candidatus Cloacimonadota bacterium]